MNLSDYQATIRSLAEISAVCAAGTIVFMALAVQESARLAYESPDIPRRELTWNRARNWVLARASLAAIALLVINTVYCFTSARVASTTTAQARMTALVAMSAFSLSIVLIILVVAFYILFERILLRRYKSPGTAAKRWAVRQWRLFRHGVFTGKTWAYWAVLCVLVAVAGLVLLWLRSRVSSETLQMVIWALAIPIAIASGIALKLVGPLGDYTDRIISERLDRRAALAIVSRGRGPQREVLMNRQREDPYLGEWILLGGYHNPETDFAYLNSTAVRRVKDLTKGDDLEVAARRTLLRTRKKVRVIDLLDLRKYGLIDVEVIEMVSVGTDLESYTPTNPVVEWFNTEKLQKNENEIPPHIYEAAEYALSDEPDKTRAKNKLRYWEEDGSSENRPPN